MSWLFKSDWVANPRNPTNADLDNLAKDQGRSGVGAWGGDVDGGGYTLLNAHFAWAGLTGVPLGVWSVSGSDLIYSTGRVTIGTGIPAAPLDVSGAAAKAPELVLSAGKFDSSGPSVNKLALYNNPGAAVYGFGISNTGGIDALSADNFSVYAGATNVAGTGAVLRMRLSAAGMQVTNIPTYASDAAAGSGGLTAGAAYKHADGSACWKL